MTSIRRFLATLVAAFALTGPAHATTFSTDFTDLWWNPSEDGWGLNLIQQYDTIFATLFVYGSDNTARWYVASSLTGSATSYSGTLYQTTGSPFSAAWNQAQRTTVPVGTMTVTFNSATSGTLSYTVSGATVTKAITRQTWRANVLTGAYFGGMTAIASSCRTSTDNGPALIVGDLNVTHANNAVTFAVDFFNNRSQVSRCTFSGTMSSAGRFGSISGGTLSCTQAGQQTNTGTFSMSQIDAGANGFTATFTGQDNFCTYNGYFGGPRDVQ